MKEERGIEKGLKKNKNICESRSNDHAAEEFLGSNELIIPTGRPILIMRNNRILVDWMIYGV